MMTHTNKFNSISEIVDDLRAGKMVVIVDDENRENEGDLLMLAEHITAEAANFMVTHGRGLMCLTMTEARCAQLGLGLIRKHGQAHHATNFTESIEAARGVTTGISTQDRATTVLAAIARDAKPEDIVTPGHIFPIMAREGGVLVRAGHTEAGCDLARMAGSEPAAVIVEVLNADGTMARRDDLFQFVQEHGLKIGTIEALIRYRVEHERTIELVHECPFSTAFGEWTLKAFSDTIKNQTQIALVKGDIDVSAPVLVRVHVEKPLHDTFSATRGHGWPLHDAMARIEQNGSGVIVMLRNDATASLLEQVKNHDNQPAHAVPKPKKERQLPPEYLWAYGVGAQILTELGISKMRLMSAPKSFHGLAGFGLQIEEYVSP